MRLLFALSLLWISTACAKPRLNQSGTQTRDVIFARRAQKTLSIRLLRPASIKEALPVVLYFHGGAWKNGSHENLTPVLLDLARARFAVASVEFRSADQARFPAQLDDARAAIRWIKESAPNYSLDPNRIGVYGASTGGLLAGLLAFSGSSVRCAALQSAPCNLTTLEDGSRLKWNGAKSPLSALLGFAPKTNPEAVRRASPIFYADEDAPPTLLLAGSDDDFISARQSDELYRTLQKAGAPVSFQKFEGEDHDLRGVQSEVSRAIVAWFARHLKGAPH